MVKVKERLRRLILQRSTSGGQKSEEVVRGETSESEPAPSTHNKSTPAFRLLQQWKQESSRGLQSSSQGVGENQKGIKPSSSNPIVKPTPEVNVSDYQFRKVHITIGDCNDKSSQVTPEALLSGVGLVKPFSDYCSDSDLSLGVTSDEESEIEDSKKSKAKMTSADFNFSKTELLKAYYNSSGSEWSDSESEIDPAQMQKLDELKQKHLVVPVAETRDDETDSSDSSEDEPNGSNSVIVEEIE